MSNGDWPEPPGFLRFERPSPERFVEAGDRLEEKDAWWPIDHRNPTVLHNLFPYADDEEIRDALGLDHECVERWTPERMQRRVDELERGIAAEAEVSWAVFDDE